MTTWKDVRMTIDRVDYAPLEVVSIEYQLEYLHRAPRRADIDIRGLQVATTTGVYDFEIVCSWADWLDLMANPKGCAEARGVPLGGLAFEGLRK